MSNPNTNAASGGGSDFTTAPAVAPGIVATMTPPEFVAMPSPGQACPYSGLKRGMLYTLANDGLIRTVSLRRKNTTRARRLIVYASLMSYLRGLDAEQNGQRNEGGAK